MGQLRLREGRLRRRLGAPSFYHRCLPFLPLADMHPRPSPGKWEDKFEAERFVEGDFHVDKKTSIKVPMTHRVGYSQLYQERELSSWVLLQHYSGGFFSLLILPDLGKMKQLEDRLSQKHLSKILRGINKR